MQRIALTAGILALAALGCRFALASGEPSEPQLAAKAAAILKTRCFTCHGADAKGGLDLRTRAAMLKGGGRGSALVPGKSAESLLYRVISGQAKPAMPLGAPLPEGEIATLKSWIDRGAPWSDGGDAGKSPVVDPNWAFRSPSRPKIPAVKNKAWVRNPIDAFILSGLEKNGLRPSPEADRQTLLRRVSVDLTGIPPTPAEIEAFLADRSPNAYEKVVDRLLASPRYGERWAQHWLDVVRFAETNGFELDADRPHAWRYRDYVIRSLNEDKPYSQFITEQIAGDELAPDNFDMRVATGFLRAGPQHVVGGNQDAAVNRQEWLTEAVSGVGSAVLGLTIGCARCHDHKFDPIPQADYYRLQAYFAATDSLDVEHATPAEKEARAAAMRAHQERLKPIQAEIAALEKPYRERLHQEKLAKLDPEYRAAVAVPEKQRTPEQQRLARNAQPMLRPEWTEVVAALTPADRERRTALRRRMHALNLDAPAPLPVALGVADKIAPTPAVHVLKLGDPHSPAEEVQPGFPRVLAVGDAPAPDASCMPAETKSTGRRTALAQWLTRPDHPLTARVMANRLWHHHLGRGIVATPNDFGRNGKAPTHPELLDWLAAAFAGVPGSEFGVPSSSGSNTERGTRNAERGTRNSELNLGWSLKRLHRLIVTSAAYRQSSAPDAAKAAVDPENLLLWRMNRRRLDAEAIRDSIVRAAGTLNVQMGGPSVRVPLEPEVYDTIFTEGEPDNLWPVTPDARQHTRRSLYLFRKRNVRLPMFVVFDAPDMLTPCGARGQSVHALQALTLLNSDFMLGQSRALAQRLLTEERGGTQARIRRLYLVTLGRLPGARELEVTERFLRDQTETLRERAASGERIAGLEGLPKDVGAAEAAAWIDLCLAQLNLNEFIYLK